jgi:hypothetical protein
MYHARWLDPFPPLIKWDLLVGHTRSTVDTNHLPSSIQVQLYAWLPLLKRQNRGAQSWTFCNSMDKENIFWRDIFCLIINESWNFKPTISDKNAPSKEPPKTSICQNENVHRWGLVLHLKGKEKRISWICRDRNLAASVI